ncbi:MAG: hypothetical protein RLZZ618_341 [Pseudomonadota bacterium]|jgi:signal transduction histidine kinase
MRRRPFLSFIPAPWSLLAVLLLLVVGSGAAWRAAAADIPPEVLVLKSALSVSGAEAQFPAQRPALSVSLPDDWWETRPREDGPIWYRLKFDAPRSGDPLTAVYIERACSNAEVYLNGAIVARGGRMSEPVTRNCYYPQLVSLPSSLLRDTDNTLDIKVQGYALQKVAARQRSGGLSQVRVGPHSVLADLHASQLFWNITIVEIITIATSVLGLLVLCLGWLNRGQPHLIYFGLLTLTWNLISARVLLQNTPLDNHLTEMATTMGFAVAVGLGVQFLLSYGGLRSRTIEIGLVIQALAVPASLAFSDPQRMFALSSAWLLMMLCEALAVAGLYLFTAWRNRNADFWPMTIALGSVCALLVFERAVQLDLVHSPLRVQLSALVMPIVFTVLGSRQFRSFGNALQAAEASRNSLESRVADATAEMERNYTQMAELRVEQVTEKERKRIAGDLHDDLGAKLLTIVHTSESERISTLAREALEEMRLSVKGLTGKPLPVGDALADWRAETVLRLGQAGVEADWRSPTEDLTQQLSARAFVQTTRILREAVSNVIKHSGASHCKVRCSLGEHDFVLVVQDNGKGIPMELDGKLDRGHGMASMKHRAKQMQGQCLVESGPGYGTVIRLTLPL